MSVIFHYDVRDGWLHCGVAINDQCVSHSVSGGHEGSSDGLSELILAICAMFDRCETAVASFEEEPGEFRWRIDRLTSNRIRVRVLEFADYYENKPDEQGKSLFDQPCGLVKFARAVYDGTAGSKREVLREKLRAILDRFDYS